jgi:hypothetical protein
MPTPDENHKQIIWLKEKVMTIETKMDKIYYALVGNELSQDGGMIQGYRDTREDVKTIKSVLEKMKERAIKSSLQVNILWLCAGGLGMAIVSIITDHIFKK